MKRLIFLLLLIGVLFSISVSANEWQYNTFSDWLSTNRTNIFINNSCANGGVCVHEGQREIGKQLNNTLSNFNDSLILLYHFNNNSGLGEDNSNVHDFSGNNLNGSMTGNVKSNKIGYINGSINQPRDDNGGVGQPDNGKFTFLNATFMAWVKASSIDGDSRTIIGKDDNTLGRSFEIYFQDVAGDKFGLNMFNTDSTFTIVRTNTLVTDDTWYHVVATYQFVADTTSKIRLYINGVQDSSTSDTARGPIKDTTATFNIGRRTFSGFEDAFHGNIDEVAVYNRTFSASEVAILYQSQVGNYSEAAEPNLTISSVNPLDASNNDSIWKNVTWINLTGDVNITIRVSNTSDFASFATKTITSSSFENINLTGRFLHWNTTLGRTTQFFNLTIQNGSGAAPPAGANTTNIQNCTLYTNSSGSWSSNRTIGNGDLASDTEYNISLSMTVAGHVNWNVECCNSKNMCNFSVSNRTLIVAGFPTFTSVPANATLEYTIQGLNVDFDGTDAIGFDSYFINDTARFTINTTGGLVNDTLTPVSFYHINVSINNTNGLVKSILYLVNVSDTKAPTVTAPANATIEFNTESLSVDFNATDASAVDTFYTNDTTKFNITNDGVLTNKTKLAVGDHEVLVSVNDTYNNTNTTGYKVTVQDTTAPTFTVIPANASLLFLRDALSVQFNATDASGIGVFFANHTSNFTMSLGGLLTNATPLKVGVYELNVSVNDTFNNVQSVGYKVNVSEASITLLLNSINASRKYEYQTTANLSVNTISASTFCFNILDDTGRYLNYECGTGNRSINYSIDILRINEFNDTTTSKTLTNNTGTSIFIDNRNIVYNFTFNVSGPAENVTILTDVEDNITLIGKLANDLLQQDIFIFSGTEYKAVNISFTSAETKTITLNLTSFGDLSDAGLLNFSIKAFSLDADNVFSFRDNITNTSNYALEQNATSYPISTFEDFYNNLSKTLWTNTSDYVYRRSVPNVLSPYNSNDLGNVYMTTPSSELKKLYTTTIDLNKVHYMWIYYESGTACSCGGGCSDTPSPYQGSFSLDFTDGTGTENVDSLGSLCYQGSSDSQTRMTNITFEKLSNDNWKVTKKQTTQASGFISSTETISTAGLADYYLQWSVVAGGGGSGGSSSALFGIWNYSIGSIGINRTQGIVFGPGGGNGSWISTVLNETPSNVSTAIFNVSYDTFDSGDVIDWWISNNDGEDWESTVSDTTHTFESKGNKTKVKFTLNTTTNYTSPLIYEYSLQVISSAVEGLEIKVGDSLTNDVDLNFELNSTSTPFYYNGTDRGIRSQMNTTAACNVSAGNYYCSIPIRLITDSGGVLEIAQMNYSRSPNPIKLNNLLGSYNLLDYINFTWLMESGSVIMNNIKTDFYGSKNITVVYNSSTASTNHTLFVKYSRFNLTTPSGEEFWQIFPSQRNQTGIIPFGQNDTHGFWNATDLAYDSNIDIYMRLNESVNSCVTYFNFTGKNFTDNSDLNISLTTASKLLYDNMSQTDYGNLYSYTDMACGGNVNNSYLLPYFCLFSMCDNCTKTVDWEDNCNFVV